MSIISTAFKYYCAFILCISLRLIGQDTAVHRSVPFKVYNKITQKRDFLLAPQLDRSPETGFLTGIYYLQLFKANKDSNARTSNTETFASITERKQYILELNQTILFNKEKFIWRGFSIFNRYNEYFYGIGNNVDVKNRSLIEFNYFNTTQHLTRRLGGKYFAGLIYQYNQTYNLNYQQNSTLDVSPALGKNGSATSGIGPEFLYDNRDHVIFARTGLFLDVSALFNRAFFGTQKAYEFTNLTVDARKFIKFYKNNVIAFQAILNYNWGNVPFRQLGLMGGDVMMRGYYQGIYRDKFMMCSQLEFRIPVYKILGVVLFAGVAEVQPQLSRFNWQDLKYTYGAGLRVLLIKHERVNLSVDAGFSKNTKAVYLGSGESF